MADEMRMLEAVRSGRLDPIEWEPVESWWHGHRATFFMPADALRVGGRRVTVSPTEAQLVADELGAVLPTPLLLDLRHDQADVQIIPQPRQFGSPGRPWSLMASDAEARAHSEAIDAAVHSRGGAVSPVGKHWILDELCWRWTQRGVLHGWQVPTDEVAGITWRRIPVYPSAAMSAQRVAPQYVIQPTAAAHTLEHHDYSMTALVVRGDCIVDGVVSRTAAVLQSPELAGLAVLGGRPLPGHRMPGVQFRMACGLSDTEPPPSSTRGTDVAIPLDGPLTERSRGASHVRIGDHGPTVLRWQTALIARGYGPELGPAGDDGFFGPRTRDATRAYQRDRGLVMSGEADDATWAPPPAGGRRP
uniref:Putative peptidoglycan binding protein n=1 Tax=viral metagenome TaxID=1070528 RepID=A0A6M3ILC5_9ZZZZ